MKKYLLMVVLLSILVGNHSQQIRAQSHDYLSEENKALAERWHHDLSMNRNWNVADQILSPDFVLHDPHGGDLKGLDEVRQLDESWKNLTNVKVKHHEIIAEGDFVMIRWEMSFDHNKEIFGAPPTGNQISNIYGMDLFRIENGKITDLWQTWDKLEFMQQVGLIPAL